MRSAYSLDDVNVLMAAAGFKPVPSFETTYLKESYRNKFGTLPFEIPGIFWFGTFEVKNRGA